MNKIIIIASYYDPWQGWNLQITNEFERKGQAYEYCYVESAVISTTIILDNDIYFVRSNSTQAQAICAYLYHSGRTIINGVATSYYWPRIALLNQLRKFNISVPKSYCGFNLSSLHSLIPIQSYPLIEKKAGASYATDTGKIIKRSQLLGRACSWSISPEITKEPFYFEEFGENTILVKIYVIGKDLYAYRRFESLEEKIITKTPTLFDLSVDMKAVLLAALESCGLQAVSLDVLFNESDLSKWLLIDVNLVPMYDSLDNASELLCQFLIDLANS